MRTCKRLLCLLLLLALPAAALCEDDQEARAQARGERLGLLVDAYGDALDEADAFWLVGLTDRMYSLTDSLDAYEEAMAAVDSAEAFGTLLREPFEGVTEAPEGDMPRAEIAPLAEIVLRDAGMGSVPYRYYIYEGGYPAWRVGAGGHRDPDAARGFDPFSEVYLDAQGHTLELYTYIGYATEPAVVATGLQREIAVQRTMKFMRDHGPMQPRDEAYVHIDEEAYRRDTGEESLRIWVQGDDVDPDMGSEAIVGLNTGRIYYFLAFTRASS